MLVGMLRNPPWWLLGLAWAGAAALVCSLREGFDATCAAVAVSGGVVFAGLAWIGQRRGRDS